MGGTYGGRGGAYPQQLGGEHGDGGGAIADLIVLDLRHVCKHTTGHSGELGGGSGGPSLTNQNFGGGVIDPDGFEDGGAVVGHRHRAALPATEQDFILTRRRHVKTHKPNVSGTRGACTHHPFGAQRALHQVADGDGAHEGRLRREEERALLNRDRPVHGGRRRDTNQSSGFSSLFISAVLEDVDRGHR